MKTKTLLMTLALPLAIGCSQSRNQAKPNAAPANNAPEAVGIKTCDPKTDLGWSAEGQETTLNKLSAGTYEYRGGRIVVTIRNSTTEQQVDLVVTDPVDASKAEELAGASVECASINAGKDETASSLLDNVPVALFHHIELDSKGVKLVGQRNLQVQIQKTENSASTYNLVQNYTGKFGMSFSTRETQESAPGFEKNAFFPLAGFRYFVKEDGTVIANRTTTSADGEKIVNIQAIYSRLPDVTVVTPVPEAPVNPAPETPAP